MRGPSLSLGRPPEDRNRRRSDREVASRERSFETERARAIWEFCIDVGGTFTDCIARAPDGRRVAFKTLSSGRTKGQLAHTDTTRRVITDPGRSNDPAGFWTGCNLSIVNARGDTAFTTTVTDFQAEAGELTLAAPLPRDTSPDAAYELSSDEEAPLLAIRYVLGQTRLAPLPPLVLKLGTTRGTNALLTRTGARVGLITTRGFGDILQIGNQDRPELFQLAIRKLEPLYEAVVEVDERLDSRGEVLTALDEDRVRQDLGAMHANGIESLAICFLHSYRNPEHERAVARVAREVGFEEISVSSDLAPVIKLVSRGDTTVLDAYLTPVLRQYVNGLQQRLSRGVMRVMTSAGGLVRADRFSGRDSLLSGPAGGVVGSAQAAQRAGYSRSIAFDMGGTSTDVSRFDGSFEVDFESRKAGVRITAPTLAIETVAAGGGSICGFDGVRLFVGPASAGADPGPACYGRGGPLTVTDLNLALGRLVRDRFPFPLDLDAVERELDVMCEQIQTADAGNYSRRELAEGLLEIANANMTRAIRRISVARGYDPADYVLVSFGGAGAQHACALADALNITTVLIPPYAGLLSAAGIGAADVRSRQSAAILEPWPVFQSQLTTVFTELTNRAKQSILAQGVSQSDVLPPRRSLELRYVGQEATITVPEPSDADYPAACAAKHEQLYGYAHTGREIEVVNAHVEVIGRTASVEDPRSTPSPARITASDTTQAVFSGEPTETGLVDADTLRPGDLLEGPAIIVQSASTVVVPPGWSAQATAEDELQLTRSTSAQVEKVTPQSTTADPVRLEIFNNRFASIAEQMGLALQHTSVSTNVKERLDFSCAVFDASGDLVVNAPHIPVHLGAMGETVRRLLQDNPQMAPGDVFVTNDPFRGGSHLPDVTVITPVFDPATDELVFLTASRAHHAEIGGVAPGSMPAFSKNLAEEGVLIRSLKLVDRGQTQEENLRELLSAGRWPSRAVEDNLADIRAQVAANQAGARQLLGLIETEGRSIVLSYMQHIQRAAEKKMRQALATVTDGEYARTDYLDDGSPISVTIRIDAGQAAIDFAGTGPVLASNLNANRAITTAAVMYVLRCLIDEDIPLNGGVLKPVSIELPECLLNPPSHTDAADCAAMAGGNVETSQRIVDVLLGALGLAAASQGTMNNLTFGDGTFGYYETICGGAGATDGAHGAHAVQTHMTNTRLTDPEILEYRYPVRLVEFSIRSDSGGWGRWRGGNGIRRVIEFLASLEVSMLSQRRGQWPPFGLKSGQPGEPGCNTIQRHSGKAEDCGGSFAIQVAPGDRLVIETPGGGGYGYFEF